MKKIAIIGNGTAGCLTAAHYAYTFSDKQIDWYYDPEIKPQAVGEGSLLDLPQELSKYIKFNMADLINVGGSIKTGIRKIDWADVDIFDEQFLFGRYAIHFNAVNLQKFILNKLEASKNINIIKQNITSDQIDADHIINCTGFPYDFSQYIESEYIPVNTAYVTQCFWEYPRFNHTLTIARPYGWVFGIPLQNRCAIGYLYNLNINSLEHVKEDVQNVFDILNLIPSNITNHLKFKNYYRQQNYTKRISYNGNASLFLEPLEATTINIINRIKRWGTDIIYNTPNAIEISNNNYDRVVDEVETIIMLHYLGGSKFKTTFWDFAKERAYKKIEQAKASKTFIEFMEASKINLNNNNTSEFGTWDSSIMNQNINIYKHFKLVVK